MADPTTTTSFEITTAMTNMGDAVSGFIAPVLVAVGVAVVLLFALSIGLRNLRARAVEVVSERSERDQVRAHEAMMKHREYAFDSYYDTLGEDY